jgi:DKNYY family
MRKIVSFSILLCFSVLINCKNSSLDKYSINNERHPTSCTCPLQFELADSSKLKHLKGLFYKSEAGQLYNKTLGHREIKGHLQDHIYFNGYFPQEVDPFTFKILNGWYAKDKNYVYYYRPTNGGMQISKIDEADSKTFEVLKGHNKYAEDEKYYFEHNALIFEKEKSEIFRNKNGIIFKLKNGNKVFEFEILN